MNVDSLNKGMAWNRFWLFIGLLPFLPSLFLAMTFGKPKILLTPLYGFCPLDIFQDHSTSTPQQILTWGCVTGAISIAFAIYSFFVKPLGFLFALTIWASTVELIFRLIEFLNSIHDI
jgi:hypothetical protein